MPNVQVRPDTAVIQGGMNIVVSPMQAKPGTASLAYNYEYAVDGGVERVLGIEPFDGQPAPSAATYRLMQCAATISGISLGNTVTGLASGATGKVIYLSGNLIGVTRVAGTFQAEALQVGGITKATVSSLTPSINGLLDNMLFKLAADEYQSVIGQVPGEGAIRGLAILNDIVYAWRDNVGATAMAIYKSSSSGWTAVSLLYELSFTTGSTEPAEGATINQGGVSATVKRVVLESGGWGTADAAGRFIITAPAGGAFVAGALTVAANGTIPAAGTGVYHGTAITLSPGGRVRTDAYNFTAARENKRLYGCDGVNREFEFDGTVLAPIVTGMATVRATTVRCHKNHLFYGYRGSLQHSGIGSPYAWSVVLGAGELGTGDEITNLISVGGATDSAALMVLCRNAMFVLYGTSSLTWELLPLSRVAGAQADSAQDVGGVVAMDTPGVMRYPATQSFGNFAWDTVSMQIQPIAREKECACSVFVTGQFKYRLFFADGTAISGLPISKGQFAWSIINVGRAILFAEHDEISGVARTFYADGDGWVYEADKGRSFAGDSIDYALKLQPLSQRSPMIEKTYRYGQLEIEAQSACTLYTLAEFGGSNDGNAEQGATETSTINQLGNPGLYDFSNYDESYWGATQLGRNTIPIEGDGTNVALIVTGNSDDELPHKLHSVTIVYTPRKITA